MVTLKHRGDDPHKQYDPHFGDERSKKPPSRPTLLGVAPPAPGSTRPGAKGENGRYSIVRGKSIR